MLLLAAIVLACFGCKNSTEPPAPTSSLVANDSPEHAVERFRLAYEQKKAAEYQGMFTGDFTYEFSSSTDPTLVQKYSTGWFKDDEKESSSHLFAGYTPAGGATLDPASSITINFSVKLPSDDNSAGVDPTTHKVLATPVDGQIVIPQPGSDPYTYVISNNFNVFYIVRGDSAAGLDSSQPADAQHWYIYKWTDLTSAPKGNAPASATLKKTWGKVKADYR